MQLQVKDNCPLDNFNPCRQFDCAWFMKVQGNNPLKDLQLLGETISSLIRGNAMAKPDAPIGKCQGLHEN